MADSDNRRRAFAVVGRDPDSTFYADRVAQVEGGERALVLGCGDGRIACELAIRGVQVVGVEPSGVMLQLAEDLRSAQPQEVQGRLRLLHADLRSVRLSEKFPVVLAPQNALGLSPTLEDLETCLATVVHHLEPGGFFAFDLTSVRRESVTPGPDEGHPHGPGASGEGVQRLFVPHLRERRRGRERESASSLRRLRVRHFTAAEIDAALARVGLVALERYGSFDETPYAPEHPLQLVVAGVV